MDEGRRSDLVISDEEFFGGVASPQPRIEGPQEVGAVVRIGRQTSGQPSFASIALHLSELSEVASAWGFTQTKVLETVRRQDTWFASVYAEISREFRGASQKSFERWVQYLLHQPVGYYLGGGMKLDYFSRWEKVTQAVSRDNVLLLPFELLKEDSSTFLRRWLGFLEVEEVDRVVDSLSQSSREQRLNVRSKSESVWALQDPIRTGLRLRPARVFRELGLPTRMPRQWPDFNRDGHIHLTSDLRAEIVEAYADSNRMLDNRIPHLDLKKYNYYD